MFDLDKWQEIWTTVRQNKTRTFLTGFSVAWGIMMLVILLGAAQGLSNGVRNQFLDDALNSFWIRADHTSVPYKGLKSNRRIQLKNEDWDHVKNNFEQVSNITARFNMWSVQINYKEEGGVYRFRAVHPDHKVLEQTIIEEGRYINESDLQEVRKVAVIGRKIKNDLFKDEDPIGKYVNIYNIPFLVVGWYTDGGSENEESYIYVPINVGQKIFGGGSNVINQLLVAYDEDMSMEESEVMRQALIEDFAERKIYDVKDTRAMRIRSVREEMENILKVIGGIEMFIWIIGLGTIVAGIVGVSNIMIVVVNERTREIGVRKALGATPGSVIGMILQESIVITMAAGYIGMVLGIIIVEWVGGLVQHDFFLNPGVNLEIALTTLGVLVIAGAAAGFFPARKAAMIKPIEALRDE